MCHWISVITAFCATLVEGSSLTVTFSVFVTLLGSLSPEMGTQTTTFLFFFFQAEDGIRDHCVTGVQTCALPICGQHQGCGLPLRAYLTKLFPSDGLP